jgi:enamine deaminase RidA (YjgF/YER057c/UK114 family)
MARIEARLTELGLSLPAEPLPPNGMKLPFPWVNLRGDRAFVSGHGPHGPDGALQGPFGQLGDTVTVEEGYALARLTGLCILGSLHRALGDLDRITGWAKVLGMVNSKAGFDRQPLVINGFSELILDVFGPETGRHARSAVGMAGLPGNMALEIEAEVLIRS